ncbi:MAG: 2-C-methyl-D-erythritol 4-phosphate cytidylyltransferase [Clostridia bacterium]|nr:2-C-methyl-D-erythritol 4-phosphate cytidylyltransferase [Clostridia bacterium]
MGLTYQISRILRTLNGKIRPKTAAVVLAGGVGARMQCTETTKQLLTLCGVPVVVRSVMAFDSSPYIDEIVVVVRQEEKKMIEDLLRKHQVKKVSKIVLGGETRQQSAEKGLDAVSPAIKYIAIHDAARCLITPKMIDKVVSAAYGTRAASAGTPASDTVKEVDKNGFVTKTPERATVWLAQTPQVFQISLYRVAVEMAKKDSFAVTDDNMLVERLGQAVKMVDCGKENIKLTVPQDLLFAEAILQSREKGVLPENKD